MLLEKLCFQLRKANDLSYFLLSRHFLVDNSRIRKDDRKQTDDLIFLKSHVIATICIHYYMQECGSFYSL